MCSVMPQSSNPMEQSCLQIKGRDSGRGAYLILKQIASLILMLASGGLVHVRLMDKEAKGGEGEERQEKRGNLLLWS